MTAISRRTALWAAPALAVAVQALTVRALALESAGPAAVGIDNFAFTPQIVTVPKGTEVTWTNHDDIPHQVICLAVKMKSKVLDTDQSASFRFEEPGTFDYFCGLHPHMQGKVVVTG